MTYNIHEDLLIRPFVEELQNESLFGYNGQPSFLIEKFFHVLELLQVFLGVHWAR